MKQIPSNIRILYDAHLEEKAISQRSRFYYKNGSSWESVGGVRWIGIQLKEGGEVFSEWLAGGLRHFMQLRHGGPPGSPLLWSGENSGGGRPHPYVTAWNDPAGSFGIEEKISPPFPNIHFRSWTRIKGETWLQKSMGFQLVLFFHIMYEPIDSNEEPSTNCMTIEESHHDH